jgi:ABC-type uncharacterized transport system substrate-binding protein
MMEYCAFGMTKIASEQGEWAGKAATMILKGKAVEEIPVAKNSHFVLWVNPEIAGSIKGFPFEDEEYKRFPDDYQGK